MIFEHRYDQEYIMDICDKSPVVPRGHVHLWAKGLWHGLNRDYLSAASILTPQVEHLVRVLLKQSGAHTQTVDDDNGVESEKGLGALLEMREAEEVLGAGLRLGLEALLTEQAGANLRNHIAHGLFSDAEAWSYASVYVWWLCLRLATLAVWQTRAGEDAKSDNE